MLERIKFALKIKESLSVFIWLKNLPTNILRNIRTLKKKIKSLKNDLKIVISNGDYNISVIICLEHSLYGFSVFTLEPSLETQNLATLKQKNIRSYENYTY